MAEVGSVEVEDAGDFLVKMLVNEGSDMVGGRGVGTDFSICQDGFDVVVRHGHRIVRVKRW